MNYFNIIPSDIIEEISMNLKTSDIGRFTQTNQRLKEKLSNDSFWFRKTHKDYLNRIPPKLYGRSWKEIYKMLFQRSQMIWIKAPGNRPEGWNDDEFNEALPEFLDEITEIVNNINQTTDERLVLRGDVVMLDNLSGYRNDGKLIWDGERVISLDYDLDDYGNVPCSMTFPDFPPDHFIESVYHNYIFHLSTESKEELKRNFDEETQTSCVTDKYNCYPVVINTTDKKTAWIKLSAIPNEALSHVEYYENEVADDNCINIDISFDVCSSSYVKGIHKARYSVSDIWIPYISEIKVVDPRVNITWVNNNEFIVTKPY